MQISYFKYFKYSCNDVRGFSLVELIVVMVIVAILATGVVFMFTDPTAKVKAAAFEMRGDFNLARAEAVKENKNVLISFDLGTSAGYRICFDSNDDSYCYDETGDNVIKDVVFRDSVTFYDFTSDPLPSNGPTMAPSVEGVAAPLTGENGTTLAVYTIGSDDYPYIEFMSNGTCDQSGVVIVYLSQEGNPSSIRGRPYAVVVGSASTGNVTLERWRPESGIWSRK